jgi:hypothetical protein
MKYMETQVKLAGIINVRFQVLTAASMMFRAVFWDIIPLKRRSTIILHGSITQKTALNREY